MTETCIIIGASHAGGQVAISLRQAGWTGKITLIGEESYLPYHRPPLSKDFLSGGKDLSEITIRPESTYEMADVECLLGDAVTQIDRDKKQIVRADGQTLSYDKLVLCTGARPRELPIQGADLPNVFYLRNAADVLAIKVQVKPGRKAVIIGGGYIGLETAASLTKQSMQVCVLEMAERILQRVTAPIMSGFYKRVHESEGVKVFENCVAGEIAKTPTGLKVITPKEEFEGDMVIIGIGVVPNTELAQEAGLEVGNGIVVDEFCCTSDPHIYACGDVTWHYNPIYDRHIRLESVPNATDQAKTIAGALTGKNKPYSALPWFWSDQFDLKLQIAGLSAGFDDLVLRGDPQEGRSFAAFYFKGERLLAVDAVNRPQEYMIGRRLIPMNKIIDKKALADEAVALKTLL
ncbi:MAG: pyridine nucleotide-disulfide oxidoreductase [Robiginitomaculum sp.]|nr:MAG: pyridine nucleotide-disulfide oxidoreductase [Robiginitomaculum sp.]